MSWAVYCKCLLFLIFYKGIRCIKIYLLFAFSCDFPAWHLIEIREERICLILSVNLGNMNCITVIYHLLIYRITTTKKIKLIILFKLLYKIDHIILLILFPKKNPHKSEDFYTLTVNIIYRQIRKQHLDDHQLHYRQRNLQQHLQKYDHLQIHLQHLQHQHFHLYNDQRHQIQQIDLHQY